MDANFWLRRWEKNEIGFHTSTPNLLLTDYFDVLSLTKGKRVFLPLCGKTLDIAWLLSNGYRVAGAELSEMAIKQLFAELGVAPSVSEIGEVRQYRAENIDLFIGDIFHLSSEVLGSVDAIYDRAALVALPEAIRHRYATHLMEITNKVPQLLITYEYDQHRMEGPPFSVSRDEINQHYGDTYNVMLVASNEVAGGLKGRCAAIERVWRLGSNQSE